jgi:multidrug efflux pump subunit AcrB
VVAGVSAYNSLPRESFPEIKIPLILIYTPYSGVSPEDIETLITRPIETELKSVTGIKEIRSTSSEGLSLIEVEFNPDVDLDTALQKVREKVDLAKAEIPKEADDTRIQDIDFSQIPILIVNLSGELGMVQLKEIAEDLKDDLEAVSGVNRVQVIGGREREVHVFADPRRLSFYELSLSDLVEAVSKENLTTPGGDIDVGRLKYLVRLPGEVTTPYEIEDFVVEVRDGQPIYVRDVSQVVYGFEDEATRARLNGKPAVTLTVEKRTGANIIAVADAVKAELARTRQRLPAGTEVTLVADQSKDIRSMVSELENSILSGLILVIVVLMLVMGFRNSLFVGIEIPLSMLLAFIGVQVLGYTLNMIVLFSLILVLGMLVDNAIVIVENIYRHREEGLDGPTAASRATNEVAMAVTTSTITTLVAFAPMLAWPGIVGDFMHFLPVMVIVGLSASLSVALIFSPTLCAYFMKAPKAPPAVEREGAFLNRYRRLLGWALEAGADQGSLGWFLRNWALLALFVGFLIAAVILALAAFILPALSAGLMRLAGFLAAVAAGAYALQGLLWIAWTLIRRFTGWPAYLSDRRSLVVYSMGSILVLTIAAYGVVGKGIEFFPEIEPRQILVEVEAPSGTNLETSDGIVSRLEELTRNTSDLLYAVANVGSTGVSVSEPALGGGVSNRSRLTLELRDYGMRQQNSFRSLAQVRERVSRVEGAEIKVDKPQDGPPTGKAVTIRISGDRWAELGRLSREVQERIRSVPGLVNLDHDLDEGKPEIRLRIDRVQAALAGVSTRDIANTVETAIRGTEASKYRIGEDEYDIRVRLAPEARASLDDLSNLTVPDEDGIPIPLRSLARLELGVGPAAIRRVDLKRVVTVEGDVVRAPGLTEDSVRAEAARRLESMSWPAGYRFEFAGSNEEEKESQAFLQQAFVFALLLILLVLVAQFDNLVVPFSIIVAVVLSLIGVLWGLMLTGTPFGIVMTGIGVICLAGVVVNNAIVLCDFTLKLRQRGLAKTQAVVEAGAIRLRPVLLTAITTVLGLIPLGVGLNIDFFKGTISLGSESSQWWAPMCVAVISGLTVATVLTLIVVPVTYHSMDDFSSALEALPGRLREWRRSRQREAGAPRPVAVETR